MKITKEELTNIIKEEVEKSLEERMSHQEYTDWADKNGIKLRKVQDKDGNLLLVPVSKPKLPKNWRTLSVTDPNRYWFRMWYKHNKKPDVAIAPAKELPSEKDPLKKLIVKRGSMPKPPTKKPRGIGSGKGGKLKYSDLNPFKDLKLRGKPILVNKDGKRTSLKTKDSQWKFRDDTIIPIYNYIPGRGRVDDEEGLKYYGFSSKKKVKDNISAATSTQKVPTEGEFLRSALERAKKGEQGEGWWGKDTKFRGNLNLWRNSMQQKYRNNIEKFKASLK